MHENSNYIIKLEHHNMESIIKCNVCFSSLLEIAYLTSCNHIFCSNCATECFKDDCICSVCSTFLRASDVHEIIFKSNIDIDIFDQALKSSFKEPNWEAVVRNFKKLSSTFSSLMDLVYEQLIFENLRLVHENIVNRKNIEKIVEKEERYKI